MHVPVHPMRTLDLFEHQEKAIFRQTLCHMGASMLFTPCDPVRFTTSGVDLFTHKGRVFVSSEISNGTCEFVVNSSVYGGSILSPFQPSDVRKMTILSKDEKALHDTTSSFALFCAPIRDHASQVPGSLTCSAAPA